MPTSAATSTTDEPEALGHSLTFHVQDRIALLEAITSIITAQPDRYQTALTQLSRNVISSSGREVLKPYALAAYWSAAASRAVLDACFTNTWHDDEGATELLQLIETLRPEWACSTEDLAYFLLALAAGARGTLLVNGEQVSAATAVRAATVTLAWAAHAEHVDLRVLFPDDADHN